MNNQQDEEPADDPGETVTIKSVSCKERDATVYNMQGVAMSRGRQLPKGVYVREGKKIIIHY